MVDTKFIELVSIYEELERISSGNEMRRILSDFFKKCPKEEIDIIAYMTLGMIDAEYKEKELGIAEKMVVRALAAASGRSDSEIKELFKAKGDLGIVAQSIKIKRDDQLISYFKIETKELSVADVFSGLRKIAEASGMGSQETKTNILTAMLQKASSEEAKYIVRISLGTLRLGVAAMTILDSLSIAFTGSKESKEVLEYAYNLCTDIGLVAKTLAKSGIAGVKKIGIQLGSPIRMMLAQRANTLSLIQEKIPGKIAAEEKYDGERMQIHKTKSGIIIYSRHLENITSQYPDVVENIRRSVKGDDFIVEGEAVAIDENGKLLPFQTVMQRKRKYDVEEYAKKIPICIYLFDLLYLNRKSYMQEPYPKRRWALEKITKETEGVQLAKRVVSENLDEIEDFFEQALERGCEGIIAKSCTENSVYRAGAREWLWIKWKKDYMAKLSDTLDLVVVGAFAGRGKRSGTYGALLCAAYNDEKDRFETVCKLGAGLTDENLEELPKKFKKFLIEKRAARVYSELEADYWFEPKFVVEVVGAEITKSPIHTCGIDKVGKGLAVRFPRFKNYRENKSAEEATTTKEIIQMFRK